MLYTIGQALKYNLKVLRSDQVEIEAKVVTFLLSIYDYLTFISGIKYKINADSCCAAYF